MGPKNFLFVLLTVLGSGLLNAEQTKTLFNPFTGKLDYITALSTTSIQAGTNITVSTNASGVTITGSGGGSGSPGGSDTQIQYNNGGSFGGTTNPTYSNSTGLLSFSGAGYVMTDSAGCTWGMTVNTLGALVSTLINCPTSPVSFRPCTTGMPLGLLLVLTCQ